MSFDMTGSLTSTPTHAPGLAASGAAGYPPTAQSTPVTSFHRMSVAGGGQASLLTTPNLSTNDDQVSAHSTPKMSKLSPTSSKERGETPRTPTPFKRALARAREPLSNTPQTPTKRLEDINDIIKKDMLDISHSSTPNFYQVRNNMMEDEKYFSNTKLFRPCKIVATEQQTSAQCVELELRSMIVEIRRTPVLTERWVRVYLNPNDSAQQDYNYINGFCQLSTALPGLTPTYFVLF